MSDRGYRVGQLVKVEFATLNRTKKFTYNADDDNILMFLRRIAADLNNIRRGEWARELKSWRESPESVEVPEPKLESEHSRTFQLMTKLYGTVDQLAALLGSNLATDDQIAAVKSSSELLLQIANRFRDRSTENAEVPETTIDKERLRELNEAASAFREIEQNISALEIRAG